MAILDLPDGRYVDVNPAFVDATGYEMAELVGRTPAEVGISVDEAAYAQWLENQMSKGGLFEAEGLFRRRDGSLRTYQAWADAGQPTLLETARETARQALAAPPANPLPAGTLEALRQIVAEADARAGLPPRES